jgi:hypothetical protein
MLAILGLLDAAASVDCHRRGLCCRIRVAMIELEAALEATSDELMHRVQDRATYPTEADIVLVLC